MHPAVAAHTGGHGPLIETTIRVATWNLWWRFGPWPERFPAIVATLQAADPDVVALQEVWGEGATDQAALLAEALGGFHHAYGHRWEGAAVQFGNAILSRWPIVASEQRPLPAPPDLDELRTVLRADIEGPRGRFSMFTTHLNYQLGQSRIRQDQVGDVCRFVRETAVEGHPPLVAGDFNAVPDSDEVRMMTGRMAVPAPPLAFRDVWDVAGEGPGLTWSPVNPFVAAEEEGRARVDYLFTAGPGEGGRGMPVRVDLLGDHPVDGMWPSDHFGVVADLRH